MYKPFASFQLSIPVRMAGALAIAWGLGLDVARAAADLANYAPVGMRQRFEELPGGVRAINDAYNANPASMKAASSSLRRYPTSSTTH